MFSASDEKCRLIAGASAVSAACAVLAVRRQSGDDSSTELKPNSTTRARPDFVGDPGLRQSPRTLSGRVRSSRVLVVEFVT